MAQALNANKSAQAIIKALVANKETDPKVVATKAAVSEKCAAAWIKHFSNGGKISDEKKSETKVNK